MEQIIEPTFLMNQQTGRTQVLTIEGCRVKVNYLPSEKRKENVLGNIQKSLLTACQRK